MKEMPQLVMVFGEYLIGIFQVAIDFLELASGDTVKLFIKYFPATGNKNFAFGLSMV